MIGKDDEMFIIFSLSLASLFASMFLLALALAMSIGDRARITSSLRRLDAYAQISAVQDELSIPFLERVILPAAHVLARVGRKLTPTGYLKSIKRKMELAGASRCLDIDRFLALKTFLLLAGLVPAAILVSLGGWSSLKTLLSTGLVALCFFAPDLWLARRAVIRRKAIRRALPDMLDLLTISVEAGLGFDAALHKVVNNTSGPLSEEFFRLLQEIQLGTSRSDAFRNLGRRTAVDELDSFILAVLQAEVFGIAIGNVLRVQSSELRIKRRQRAEEMAQKAPVKIIFPVVTCILPSVFVVVMGPAAIRIYETILKTM